MKNKIAVGSQILAAVILLAAAASYGVSPTGMAFLKINPSPKAYALGGSNAIAGLGAESSNPAQIGLADKKYELFSSSSSLMDGAQFGHVAPQYLRHVGGEGA